MTTPVLGAFAVKNFHRKDAKNAKNFIHSYRYFIHSTLLRRQKRQEFDSFLSGLLGLNAGVTMVYSFNEQWGLGMDLKYSGEGMAIEQGGLVAKTKLDYIRVPLKLYGFFNQLGDDFRPKVYIGPSFGFLAGGETEQFVGQTIRTVDSKDWFEPFDLGVIVGTGFNYRLLQNTWLNFDVAYTHGLLDIVKIGEGSNRNMNVNLGIAWGL